MHEIDIDFAYILGAIRDGSISIPSSGKHEVTLAADSHKKWLINVIIPKAINIFGIPETKIKVYSVWSHKSKMEFFRVKIYSRKIHEILSQFYSPGNQRMWKTPEAIKSSPLKMQIEYVRGFYDADGGCRDAKKFLEGKTKSINCEIGISCVHKGELNEPLMFIKSLLDRFEVKSSIRKLNDQLKITGKQNLLKFYETFTPFNSRKRKMLEELLRFYDVVSVSSIKSWPA